MRQNLIWYIQFLSLLYFSFNTPHRFNEKKKKKKKKKRLFLVLKEEHSLIVPYHKLLEKLSSLNQTFNHDLAPLSNVL